LRLDEIGEFRLIERLAAIGRRDGSARVVLGIGDDAAAVDAGGGDLLLATCDSQIEGIHFLSSRISPDQLGRRTAAVNLSDVAAMGGCPRWALVSIAAPGDRLVEDLEALYLAMTEELEAAGAVLIGGNTARSPGGLSVDMTLLGQAPRGGLLTRHGARVGDLLCVTGSLGGAAAGLAALEAGLTIDRAGEAAVKIAISRHLTPTPRLAVGRALADSGAVSSCIDVSDGLVADAGHVAERSGVGIRLDSRLVPICPAATAVARLLQGGADPMAWALRGGDDYELAFTAAPGDAGPLLERVLSATGVVATVIGEVVEGPPAVTVDGGRPAGSSGAGYRHFEGE